MLSTLMRASLDGAVLVAIVWALVRVFRHLPAATRTVLWWCAAAKFVVALVWITPVAVPLLPASEGPHVGLAATMGSASSPPGARSMSPAVVSQPDPAGPSGERPGWTRALLATWAIGVALAAGLGLRRWRQTVAVLTQSLPAPESIQAMAADLAGRLGLRRVPRVQISDRVETPLVSGVLRPVVLLPADRFPTLSDRQQRMALCHELAHVQRADLWLGCAPALAERVFFFHPLVHLAAREYGLWREAACDATVLDAMDASPQEYGRLLLALGISRPQTGLAAAGAPWSFSSLRRRITMLREPSVRPFGARVVAAGVVVVAAGAMIPMQLTARSTHPVTVIESAAPDAPATTLATALSPVDPAGTEAPGQAVDERKREKDDLNYVLLLDENHSNSSGSYRDVERARRYLRPGEPLLWFRHDGREYVVRDRAVLENVEALWKPVSELGNQMGELGGKQGELGSRQGELGAKQGELGAEQGQLGARQGQLGARQGVMASRHLGRVSEAQRLEDEKERRDIELKMRELDVQMALLGKKMQELERPMSELGREMEVLGRQMEVLGKKMEVESKKATHEMRALIERVVRDSTAEIVK